MMTPATARTGTSALTPISGASAAARITPVPKPPRPPITAAPRPSAPTAARVGASSSNLAARYRARPAVAVDRHVRERRLGHLDDLRVRGPALGVYLDADSDRGVPDPHQVGIEGKHVADLHRLLEDELFHGDGRHAAARRAPGENAAGDVDVRHDPAAEDIAVLVGVGGHRHDAQRRQLVLGEPVRLPLLPLQVAQRPATEWTEACAEADARAGYA